MANTDNHTIKLQVSTYSPVVELMATATIKTGMLLKQEANDTVIPHVDILGPGQALFAVENELGGKDIDTDYTSGQRVMCRVARPGDVVLCWLATNQDVTVGDYLASAGGGYLRQNAVLYDPIFGIALEALITTPALPPARIRVRIV
ncbi:MAG: hypothetical protein KAS32_17115 [Candidatus Peribacteraceae bacterium]|nr:hypothetical protein [Candidatus Peribacteraceae bacterium]